MPEAGASGFDAQLYKRGLHLYKGDHGEAEFLARMQQTQIGGILVGNVDSRHMIHGCELPAMEKRWQEHIMPIELSNMVKAAVRDIIQTEYTERYFEMDFVLIHPNIGFYQIEVKNTQNARQVESLLRRGRQQILRGILMKLFGAFCEQMGKLEWLQDWERYYAGGAVYFAGLDKNGTTNRLHASASSVKKQLRIQIAATQMRGVEVIYENVENHFANLASHARASRNQVSNIAQQFSHMSLSPQVTNFFNDKLFRDFAIFLTCYRPDFFLSPVLCVLQTYENIISHRLQPVNFYLRNSEAEPQNRAISANDYLNDLQRKNLISRSDIVFPGERNNIWFTAEQLEAVRVFKEYSNGRGKLANMTQLIMGPPGSGKSLIVMMKLFILAQIRERIPLICVTWKAHSEIVRNFVDLNDNCFCRDIQIEDDEYLDNLPNNGHCDCVLDEQFPDSLLDNFLRGKTRSDVISIAVVTGGLRLIAAGDATLNQYIAPTVLQTSFRSTNHIQRFVATLGAPIAPISGHGFEGIPPEIFRSESFNNALNALDHRIHQLRNELDTSYSPEKIALIADNVRDFDADLLAMVNFYPPTRVPSLEFPIVILFVKENYFKYGALCASRAICHLIVFYYKQ